MKYNVILPLLILFVSIGAVGASDVNQTVSLADSADMLLQSRYCIRFNQSAYLVLDNDETRRISVWVKRLPGLWLSKLEMVNRPTSSDTFNLNNERYGEEEIDVVGDDGNNNIKKDIILINQTGNPFFLFLMMLFVILSSSVVSKR